jgi:hypothetical protein
MATPRSEGAPVLQGGRDKGLGSPVVVRLAGFGFLRFSGDAAPPSLACSPVGRVRPPVLEAGEDRSMFTSLTLVAGLLVAVAPADPSGAAVPELTLQYRMAPETGYEQVWRPTGGGLTLGANVPYEFRVLLDEDAWWARDVELSHWEGATASPSDEGSVTATLMVPVAMDVEVGVAVLVSGEGLAHTLTSFTSVRTVDVVLPPPPGDGGKQAAQAPGGGFGTGRPNNEVVDVQGRGQGGGCLGITESTFAWLYDTGTPDAACTATGNIWGVSVSGPVRCPKGLSKVFVRDQYGQVHDYDNWVPPKPAIPTCTTDAFVIRLEIFEFCAVGVIYDQGDIWELEIQCCDGCTKTVTLIVL